MALTPYACWQIALGRQRSDLENIPHPRPARTRMHRAEPAAAGRLSLRQALGVRLVTVGLALALGTPGQVERKAAIPPG